ncbi:MAG: helix-turn-helix transcriptional regulator [Bacteroidales bacterium]|nr:helix-turn-helix transcriptional regulator [Bacteroidales bacterium]
MKNSIKVERAKKDISQTELAEQIGVSRQTIHSIERGKFVPSTLLALKMARYFKVKMEELFQLEEDD